MGNPRGGHRDFDALEQRRVQAITLWKGGESQVVIAHQVGVVPQTVARWVSQYRRLGEVGMKKAKHVGRKAKLDRADFERLLTLLLDSPEVRGYKSGGWTCARVADLIEREFGVRYHPGHVCKLLAELGWSTRRQTN
jgi:transposase